MVNSRNFVWQRRGGGSGCLPRFGAGLSVGKFREFRLAGLGGGNCVPPVGAGVGVGNFLKATQMTLNGAREAWEIITSSIFPGPRWTSYMYTYRPFTLRPTLCCSPVLWKAIWNSINARESIFRALKVSPRYFSRQVTGSDVNRLFVPPVWDFFLIENP